jgi:hypothetical protein
MSYGTTGGVAALVPRFTNAAGVFDASTTPAAVDVTAWLGQISAMLDVALAGYGVDAPVTNTTVKAMLDGYANAQAAAVARGVNGQGRFGERPVAADEMLVAIGGDAAEWVSKWIGGVAGLLGVAPAESVVSRAGSRLPTRQTEYTRYPPVSEYSIPDVP